MRVVLNGVVIAKSERTMFVDGNHYFPKEDVDLSFLSDSETRTLCPWKGTANYFHACVSGEMITDAAWHYPEPKKKAEKIKGYIAFWPMFVIE